MADRGIRVAERSAAEQRRQSRVISCAFTSGDHVADVRGGDAIEGLLVQGGVDDECSRPRVRQHVGHLRRRKSGVDGHEDRTELRTGEHD